VEDGWLELSAAAEPEAVESLSAAFAEHGQGVALEQPFDSSRDGDVVTVPPDAPVVVKTYLALADPRLEERRARLETAVWALGKLRQVGPLQVRTLHEADWANAWKDYFFVHRVGERTVIVPSWRQSEYEPRSNDIVLLLDPGMAFGTGLHPTTRLCLIAVENLVQPGMRVLDVGAGSGILSIAAARLGAAHVAAAEIEPVAAGVCRENVERNGVDHIVEVTAGSLGGEPSEPFDLALANITVGTLLELHPLLRLNLRPGGQAVLSGVLAERADELLEALRASGWRHERTDQEQDWVALTVQRL
jgi:ribosomal protein L11 methyltransferase